MLKGLSKSFNLQIIEPHTILENPGLLLSFEFDHIIPDERVLQKACIARVMQQFLHERQKVRQFIHKYRTPVATCNQLAVLLEIAQCIR